MKKMVEKMKKKQEGFTLIELIIVIAILAIIAAIAIPNILGAVDNSRRSADVANAQNILNAAALVQAKNTNVTPHNVTLDASFPKKNDEYEEALEVALNGAVPDPKYTAATTVFFLEIKTNGTMAVKIDDKDGKEVAPNPATDYNQQ